MKFTAKNIPKYFQDKELYDLYIHPEVKDNLYIYFRCFGKWQAATFIGSQFTCINVNLTLHFVRELKPLLLNKKKNIG